MTYEFVEKEKQSGMLYSLIDELLELCCLHFVTLGFCYFRTFVV